MKLELEKLDCKYGAPMGRPNVLPKNGGPPHALRLEELGSDDADYDTGGAYWGLSDREGWVWCAWNTDGVRIYVRGKDRFEARQNVLKAHPTLAFSNRRAKYVM